MDVISEQRGYNSPKTAHMGFYVQGKFVIFEEQAICGFMYQANVSFCGKHLEKLCPNSCGRNKIEIWQTII